MYGTQADKTYPYRISMFENDVKMYGTQAVQQPNNQHKRLRMM